jgi:transcriptional regulator with XRE-family HTH domain
MDLLEIGTRIQASRKLHGLSQKALAEHAAVSRYTIVKLENGQASDVQLKTLLAILGELHLTVVVTELPVSGVGVLGDDHP